MKLKLKFRTDKENKNLRCIKCRHANHRTGDFMDGLVACKFNGGLRMYSKCDQTVTFGDGEEYYLFEEFNGRNCTWRSEETMEITR